MTGLNEMLLIYLQSILLANSMVYSYKMLLEACALMETKLLSISGSGSLRVSHHKVLDALLKLDGVSFKLCPLLLCFFQC